MAKSAGSAISRIGTAEAGNDCTASGREGLWISTKDLAELAEISQRAASDAALRGLNEKLWRGALLEVMTKKGGRGPGRKALQVYVPSLPKVLRDRWIDQNPGILDPIPSPAAAIDAPIPVKLDAGLADRIIAMNWKADIVTPALIWPKGSHQRAAALADIAAREHRAPNGKTRRFAVDTLRDWIAKVEGDTPASLARKHRADAGGRRWLICRQWDHACPLPAPTKTRIAEEVETYIRSLWRSWGSARKINSLASTKLQELGRAAGWHDAPLIAPGLYLVRRHSEMRMVNIRDNDAKKFFDIFTPRIHRSRDSLKPMEIVVGDVTPINIPLLRDDGTLVYPRMIAWLDWATGDSYYSIVVPGKGSGVTQAHVTASFVDMCMAWGLPERLYLDNGSEFKWEVMEKAFAELQGLVGAFRAFIVSVNEIASVIDDEEADAQTETATPRNAITGSLPSPERLLPAPTDPEKRLPAIAGATSTAVTAAARDPTTHAKPHNAPAKPVEGMFSALEKFLAAIPGYVGGNRMRKKTQNVGKAPKPFPGNLQQYEAAIAQAVAFYRNEQQRGTMGNKSPNQRKQEAFAAGWCPVRVDRETFLYAFSDVRKARVQNGGIEVDGSWFDHDKLLPLRTTIIEYRYAKWDGQHVLWRAPEGDWIIINKVRLYHPMDTAGAVEQGRMVKVQREHIKLLADSAPVLDQVAEMARHNAALQPPPETPAGMTIKLAGEAGKAVEVIRTAAKTPARVEKLPPLAIKHPKTGEIMEPQPPSERATVEPAIPDIRSVPPPEKKKPDASANAPGFDIYALLTQQPPLNHQAKETEPS
jgi:hypothetical protein